MSLNQTVTTGNGSESKSPNEAKYQMIFKKKQEQPDKPIAELCREVGTSYQSYNNWLKKQTSQGEGLGHKIRITVMLSVTDIARMLLNNTKDYTVSLDSLVRGMSPEEKKKLAQEIGLHQLEALTKALTRSNS